MVVLEFFNVKSKEASETVLVSVFELYVPEAISPTTAPQYSAQGKSSFSSSIIKLKSEGSIPPAVPGNLNFLSFLT